MKRITYKTMESWLPRWRIIADAARAAGDLKEAEKWETAVADAERDIAAERARFKASSARARAGRNMVDAARHMRELRASHSYTHDEDAAIMVASDRSAQAKIAADLGVTVNAIRNRRVRLKRKSK